MNKGLKRFAGEKAYNVIQNMGVDIEKLRAALITPQNARNVFFRIVGNRDQGHMFADLQQRDNRHDPQNLTRGNSRGFLKSRVYNGYL